MEVFQEQLKKLDGFYTKVLESMESKKKSPYELDLEVMDRQPDITPKEGDWVKIKSKEWYDKWRDLKGFVNGIGPYLFSDLMIKYCGQVYKIRVSFGSHFLLEGIPFGWTLAMFEKVYPQEEYTILNKSGGGHIIIGEKPVMEATHSKEGRIPSGIIPNDGTFLGCDYKQMFTKLIPDYIPSIKDLTDSCTITCKVGDSVLPFPPKQSVQAYIKPETKLRIIKTNQLIKIEKL